LRFAIAVVLSLLVPAAAGAVEVKLEPTRDARLYGHKSEQKLNGGQSTRLRTRGIATDCPEFALMDFDHKAVLDFIKNSAGKRISAKLTVVVREVQGADKIKLEAAAFQAAADWQEGKKSQEAAERGEVNYLEAQAEVAPWTSVAGKKAASFKDLVFGVGQSEAVFNSGSVEGTPAMADTRVSIALDAKVIQMLAGAPGCRGLVIFHRGDKAMADFYSREQNQHKPELVLTAE
jgi:hypothetical protein